ncbi:hypothetical protein WMY93_032323 [Mugilogobius chulae]|uniref:Uncharacterized protein n=1 Tax=Mugilogobius chulae TaxID=88201 RepID=A0AAW0MNN4_9GOBI
MTVSNPDTTAVMLGVSSADLHKLRQGDRPHCDTFKIENESDAQLVLKVTQKLTDVLMEYRLRRVEGPTVPSVFPPQPPTKPNYNEQFPGYQGLPRYPQGSRYYN